MIFRLWLFLHLGSLAGFLLMIGVVLWLQSALALGLEQQVVAEEYHNRVTAAQRDATGASAG